MSTKYTILSNQYAIACTILFTQHMILYTNYTILYTQDTILYTQYTILYSVNANLYRTRYCLKFTILFTLNTVLCTIWLCIQVLWLVYMCISMCHCKRQIFTANSYRYMCTQWIASGQIKIHACICLVTGASLDICTEKVSFISISVSAEKSVLCCNNRLLSTQF